MKKTLFFLLIVLAILLTGCGGTSEEDLAATQAFESALQTAIVETIAAALPDVPAATATFAITESPVEAPSATPTVTVPPLPTQQPTSTPGSQTSIPTDTPQPPCYRAELIEETIPDGTKFPPGRYFTKIWVIRNTGVCAWNEDFRWVLVEGEDFNGYTNLELKQVINPGEDLTVKLELKTPPLEGLYKGTYQILTDEGGSVTPLGFWVTIISENP